MRACVTLVSTRTFARYVARYSYVQVSYVARYVTRYSYVQVVSLHATRTYRSFAAFGLFFRFHFARPTLFRQRPVASWYSSTDVKSVGGWLSAVLLPAAVVAALEPRVRGEVDDFEEERFLFFFPFPLFQRGIGLSVSGAAALPVSLALPVDINARGCNKCQCSGGWWCIPSAGFK